MNRRRSSSLAGSPLLIGAVTTLIVIVAVFLSYNANNGLPFTPTYNLKVALPEASGLQHGNQVRIAGTRVGIVASLTPHQDPATGRLTAIANLKLEKSVQPLPADTTAIVQSVSAIGLKYLALEKGSSPQVLKPESTIPPSQTREPVDIDQVFNMFDSRTRTANQQNLNDFGTGFAARGLGLNDTIATLRPLVTNAIPVLHNLASPATGFRELWVALDRAAKETAPVANAQASFYSDLDTFFTAFAAAAPSLEQAIEGGPPALEQATRSLPFEAPFVEKSAEFMHLLRPSASALRTAAQPLGHAIAEGAVNLRAATALNTQLASATQALQAFAQNPIVSVGLEDLTRTLELGNPLVAGLAPAQSTCNYVTLAFRNVSSLLSESVGVGTLARAAVVLAPRGPNNEGYPSSAAANGPSVERRVTGNGSERGAVIDNNHLHANPYPNVAGPSQPLACEAGKESYVIGKAVVGNLSANGTGHESTTREQNLFGQTYPSETLKDLTAPSTASAALHAKGKGK